MSVAQITYPGGSPGAARVNILSDSSVILENNVIKMKFGNNGKGIKIEGFEDKKTHERLEIGKTTLFDLTLADKSILTSDDVNISKISLISLPVKIGIEKKGAVDGSPLVHQNMFFAVEHPMSQAEQNNTSMESYLMQLTPLTSAKSFTVSSVWGTTPVGQLRRGFLYYTECSNSLNLNNELYR